MNAVRGGEFSGQAVLVVGGAGGIGRATVRDLAALGGHVIVADSDFEGARAVVDGLPSDPGGTALEVNVADGNSIHEMFKRINALDAGPLTAAVFLAGVISYSSFLDESEDALRRVLDVNIFGTFTCVQETARQMIAQGRPGSIVVTSSTSGFIGSRRPKVAYSAAKAAVRQIALTAAVELASSGIRVNAIAPGPTDTAFAQLTTPEQVADTARQIPLGRLGRPEDISQAIVYLCSGASDFVTGHTLVIDGGRIARAG